MKKKMIYGEGVCGMHIELSLVDMIHASIMADVIELIVKRNKEIAEYDKLPYDAREDEKGNRIERPTEIELANENLETVLTLLNKLSYKAKSTLFEEEDEEDTE